MGKLEILDTTLRDGEQAPGFSMTQSQKLDIAKQLDKINVDFIEAGFPAVSMEDFTSVCVVSKMIKNSGVAGFARAKKEDIQCAYKAIKSSVRPRLHIFLAASDLHITEKLKTTKDEVLKIAVKAIKYAKSLCPEVQFCAEDATRADREFLMKLVSAAADAGADCVNIADTVGYSQPDEFAELIKEAVNTVRDTQAIIGVHCHNDLGLAAANTLAGVRAGARHIECTVSGIGERAGMAALEETIMALKTRRDYYGDTVAHINTTEFFKTAKLLESISDFETPPHKPIIGFNAFAHEAGVHQHGIMANPQTYEIMNPEDVGISERRMILGKHSGKAALSQKIKEIGYNISPKELEKVFNRFKSFAGNKKAVSDTDLRSIIQGAPKEPPVYSLKSYVINSGTGMTPTAVVKLAYKNKEHQAVEVGETAVSAAFNAVDKIVKRAFLLHHYVIESISEGKDELGESLVQIRVGQKIINGRGIDSDAVGACIKAYINAINKFLAQ